MCGIVGVLVDTPATEGLLAALERLEYRGYDSAGVALLHDGVISRSRAAGKLRNLRARLAAEPLSGRSGIGHTRWATHGAATETNAHPHATRRVAVVHNGIIENYRELRLQLGAAGVTFESDTDTEVIVQLLDRQLQSGADPLAAVRATLGRLDGAFALAMLFAGHDDLLIGARRGSPLAVGHAAGQAFLGSDAQALAPFTDRITYLEDGDWVVLTRQTTSFFDAHNQPVERQAARSQSDVQATGKGAYRHFMRKEIAEQPDLLAHALAHYLDFAAQSVQLPAALPFERIDRLAITACGTAYYAGLTASYWFERYARLPVDIDVASEFRYRDVPLAPAGLALLISQSGETADTLAGLRYCRAQGQQVAALVNAVQSTMAREADVVFPLLAGPEIGVASTKAFTAQLAVLACLVIAAGRQRGVLTDGAARELVAALLAVPRLTAAALALEPQIQLVARELADARDVLYLGRGSSYPIALEGALKLKEVSYLHAEGYAAGELKHGPIALVTRDTPVVVLAPSDGLFPKIISNAQEVMARSGRVILLTDAQGAARFGSDAAAVITLPDAHPFVQPLVQAVALQLLSYHTALLLGTDVDQPRNLAKSVTVE